ncbi:MAG: A/G-specific adenine glycosylase, partial [Patescibacteria group bacterium]
MQRKKSKFQDIVWDFYKNHGRHALPWRLTHDPYKILVSEIMLQQTQVDRVIPFYIEFIRHFPSTDALARAKTSEV